MDRCTRACFCGDYIRRNLHSPHQKSEIRPHVDVGCLCFAFFCSSAPFTDCACSTSFLSGLRLPSVVYSKEPNNCDGLLTGGLRLPDPPHKSASSLHGNMVRRWKVSLAAYFDLREPCVYFLVAWSDRPATPLVVSCLTITQALFNSCSVHDFNLCILVIAQQCANTATCDVNTNMPINVI